MAKTAAISLTKLVLTCGLISEFLRTVITQGQESLVNIARNKSANQIGAYGGATADRAIDGRLDQSIGGDTYLNVCAFADTTWDNNVPANWKLDLKAVYRIADVVIYNTYHDTVYQYMKNFRVDLLSEDKQVSQSCGVYDNSDPVSPGGNYTFNCHNIQGRYINISKLNGYTDQQYLILCEVEVLSPSTVQTTVAPPVESTAGPISDATSISTTESKAQSTPTSTQRMTSTEVVETTPYAIECDDGFYGEMCQQECGKCAPLEPPVYNPCHRTGRCINGCKMWWAGDKCQQEIVMADYDSQSLTANVISSDRIELNLEQVNVNPGLSDFYGYRVSYGSKSLEVGHQENRSHISIKLTDLSHNSEYTVEIQPYRVMSGQRGFGNKFPKRTFRTKCIVPDPPLISSITEKQVIKVKYQAPNISGCDELTQLSLYYRYTDEDNWTLVNSNSSSGSEVSVELTESKAHVFKVIAINNEGKQSEIISPDIKVSSPEEVSIFGGNTVVSWSLFVASFIINLTVLSVLTNTYCGTSRRRATGKQAEHAPSSQGEFESGSYRPKETRTRDTNDDDGSEYTMHIFGTNDDGGRSSERRKKEKREKKEKRGKNGKKGKKQGGNAEPYTDIVLESETPTSIPEHADLGFNMNTTQSSTQDPEDDYVYTTHIDKISNKMARKMKAKKEKRKIAPHYKDSDVRENEYSVVF